MNRESERKRLVELLRESSKKIGEYIDSAENLPSVDEILGMRADHLLDNGIGIKPPIELCKRKGDYIFVIDDDEVIEVLLCLVQYDSEGEDDIVVYDEWSDKIQSYKFADIGKTVFTSREEAEAKLKGGESDA